MSRVKVRAAGPRSNRHARPHLPRTLGHAVAHHAMKPDHSQQERRRGEAGEERGVQARRPGSSGLILFEVW